MQRPLTLSLILLLAAGGAAVAADPAQPAGSAVSAQGPGGAPAIFDDPEWRKAFLGSYGFLSGAEPQVTQNERELLPQVLDLLETNQGAAIELLEKNVGPGSSAALDFLLANLYFQNGKLENASAYYAKALEKFPDFRRAHKNLGLLLVQKGDYKGALVHLSRAVELGDRDGRNYGLMGLAYLNLEDHLAAEVAYRNAILQQPGTRDWKLGLARSLMALEHYRDAIGLAGELLEENPDDTTIWMLQANAYLGVDQPLAAAVDLEAVRMLGKAPTRSLVLLGDIYMTSHMPELAKSAYLAAMQSDEKGTQFHTAYRAADLLIRTRSWSEAQEILASIDQRYAGQLSDAEQLDVLTLKAKLARGQGREKDSARLLESIVERDGTRGEALIELASYYHGQGQEEKALMLIERAENIEAVEYQALLDHAQFLVTTRDYRKAAELLRRAIAIKSEPRVETYLARVERAIPAE
jgi:tetratricopeptide (TPR) repeat protein